MNDPQNPYPTAATPSSPPPFKSPYGCIGKVERLPKAVRDRINELMAAGLTYLQIIAELGEDAKDLNEDNLATWKSGGYLKARKEENEVLESRLRQEHAADLARATQGTGLCEATSKMLLGQILDTLNDAGPGSLQTALSEKPELYVRLLHAVARLSGTAVSLERERIKEAERKAQLEDAKSPPEDRSITDQTIGVVSEMLRNH